MARKVMSAIQAVAIQKPSRKPLYRRLNLTGALTWGTSTAAPIDISTPTSVVISLVVSRSDIERLLRQRSRASDPRVEDHVEHVHQEVHEHDHHGDQCCERHDDGVVAAEGGLDDE